MDETGTDFSQSNFAGPAIGQESGLSGEETVGLISRLLDSKLDKKFADFKRALEQKELSTCLLYTSPSPRDGLLSRMPSSA